MEENYDSVVTEEADDTYQTEPANEDDTVCKNCGTTLVVEGYSIPLCNECRERFTKYPIPAKIKVFAVIILAIMTFSLVSFPDSLNAGIAYERGLRAEGEKRFITAAKEYQKVVDIFPNSFIACGKLFVAQVKNHQFSEAENTFTMIDGKESSNADEVKVIDEANEALTFFDQYVNLSEELIELATQNTGVPTEAYANKINEYSLRNPDDYWGHYILAQALYDLGKYEEAKSSYVKAVNLGTGISEFRLGLAAAYRQTGEIERAIDECNAVLAKNVEFVDAYVSLCKIDLKRNKYKEALVTATNAFSYDNTNMNAACVLALAYHFNNKTEDRDTLLVLLKETDPYYYEYTKNIIDGKSKLFE